MKTISLENILKTRFDDKEIFTTEDFFTIMNDYPKPTVYSKINALLKKCLIQKIGWGKYQLGKSSLFSFDVSPKMQKVFSTVAAKFPYINVCVWDLSFINNFSQHLINYNVLFVDVDRDSVESVYWFLKESYEKVTTPKRMYDDLSEFKDFIVVRPLITMAPLKKGKSITLPSLEKCLVDLASDKEFLPFQGHEITNIFRTAFEEYTINENRMLRYAGRKGKQEEIQNIIALLS